MTHNGPSVGDKTILIEEDHRRSHPIQNDNDPDTIISFGDSVFANPLLQPQDIAAHELADLPSSQGDTEIEEVSNEPRAPRTKLSRKLEERHVNMFSFSFIVGSGLFLQNGRVIFLAGPGGALLAYPIMIMIIWAVVGPLGEMTALFPVPGALFELPARFLDQSIGYASGWMAWFSWVVIFAAELDAVATIFNFGFTPAYLKAVNYPYPTIQDPAVQWPTFGFNPALFVSLVWPFSVLVNLLPIRLYGEYEYVVGCVKMFFCVGLIMFQMIINIESGLGSRFYNSPYNFLAQSYTNPITNNVSYGSSAQLRGIWTGFCVAIYSLIGFESISITAAESKDFDDRDLRYAEREDMRISTRKLAIRIMAVYSMLNLLVGLNVPGDDPNLIESNTVVFGSGQYSAFVIAAVRAGKHAWPGVITGFFLFTTVSASINSLYLSSRLLHALALSRPVWPDFALTIRIQQWLQQVTWNGVPRNAIFASSVFGLLGYLACDRKPEVINPKYPDQQEIRQGKALGNLARNSVISILIVYVVICITFLKFRARLRRELANERANSGVFDRDDRSSYPYKSRWQPLRTILAAFACVVIILFNGWDSFSDQFDLRGFVASYISIVVFVLIWLAYRIRELKGVDDKLWSLSPTDSLDKPTRVKRKENDGGRDHLNLDIENFWSRKNAYKVVTWLWVWII